MSLARKVSFIVVLVFLVSGLLSLAIQRMVIMPSFLALERQQAAKNAERAVQAIDRELAQIEPLVSDWAYWTDTYKFAKGKMPGYLDANLDIGTTLVDMSNNFLGIYDLSGKALWNQAVDLETGEELDLGELTGSGLDETHPLLQSPSMTGDVRGIIRTQREPMLIVAKPILTNERGGPAAGTIIMGRFLDAAAAKRLSDQIQLPLAVTPTDHAGAEGSTGDIGRKLAFTPVRFTEAPESWQARSTLLDLYGRPVLALQVDTPRDISARGAAAVNLAFWSLAITGLIMMFVLWFALRRAMLQPLSKLTDHAARIGADDNLKVHLNLKRRDEIGILAGTFDIMVRRLAEARRRLVDQSFRSGVAEMAAGVLHNIGNAVTPLNVKLSTLSQDLGAAPVAEMRQAAAELAAPFTPPERRGDLARFVELAGVELADLVERSQQEVEAALRMVMQVQEIVSDQEHFSRSARVIEPVDMAAIVRDAINGLAPETKSDLEIDITPSLEEVGAVAGARAALSQVVTNLLVNAAESITEAESSPGRITVSASRENHDGRPMAHLRFDDNGGGIETDLLDRLFERRFSTKNRSGSGYGLHWTANTVQALGGRISAESDGPGRGACMHLWLPLADFGVQASIESEG